MVTVGKTIAVVGAGPGLGLAVARRFGREGFAAAMIGRSKARLDDLVGKLQAEGVEAAGFVADATDSASLAAAFDAVKARFGEVDVLEYSPIAPVENPKSLGATALTAETADAAIRLMALGAVTSVQQVLPQMVARKSGTILITTGGSAIQHIPFLAAFSMAGGAARNYALTLHAGLQGSGVFVSTVCIALGIKPGDPEGDPDLLAETYWDLHEKRDRAEVQIIAKSQALDLREFAD